MTKVTKVFLWIFGILGILIITGVFLSGYFDGRKYVPYEKPTKSEGEKMRTWEGFEYAQTGQTWKIYGEYTPVWSSPDGNRILETTLGDGIKVRIISVTRTEYDIWYFCEADTFPIVKGYICVAQVDDARRIK